MLSSRFLPHRSRTFSADPDGEASPERPIWVKTSGFRETTTYVAWAWNSKFEGYDEPERVGGGEDEDGFIWASGLWGGVDWFTQRAA